MIGRINVGGGGGLNFKIVGGTSAPANPQENTVWVNTDKDITAWMFCSSEPTDAIEGAVWFLTGASSVVSFNALKKNMLEIYPISAKQKVNGTMVDVTAKSFQNGEWVDWWNGELFDNGNQFEAITGGWSADGFSGGSNVTANSTSEISDGCLFVQAKDKFSNGIIGANNPIDLTNFDSICFDVVSCTAGNSYFIVSKTKSATDKVLEFKATTADAHTVTLDVSALSGEYYIFMYVHVYDYVTTRHIKVSKVWGCL